MPASQRPITPPADAAPADVQTMVDAGVIPPDPVASPNPPADVTPPAAPAA